MKKLLVTTLLGLGLVTSACSKKDDAAKTGDKAAADKPADKPVDKPAGEMSAADYEAKNTAMMDKAISTFGGLDKDCDKAAATVGKFFDDNKADMMALEAFEKGHPDVKKAVDEKTKDKTQKFMETAGKVMDACKDNKAMQEAVKKMPG